MATEIKKIHESFYGFRGFLRVAGFNPTAYNMAKGCRGMSMRPRVRRGRTIIAFGFGLLFASFCTPKTIIIILAILLIICGLCC